MLMSYMSDLVLKAPKKMVDADGVCDLDSQNRHWAR